MNYQKTKKKKKREVEGDFICLKNGSQCNASKSEMNEYLPKTPKENGG